jgi:cysteine desulfurase/selenocysteine lyase
MPPRCYLDNAATSWPKPPGTTEAVTSYLQDCGVAVGRGATQRGAELQATIDRCRLRAARLLGANHPRQVLFTFNGTDALNLSLHGLLRSGDHVVTTDVEHNSVLRPLLTLQQRIGIQVTYVAPDAEGAVSVQAVVAAIRPTTRLMAVSHVSNVTGVIQPVEELIAAARSRGVRTMVDAAQSAGHLPIDVEKLEVDLLACSGHKGLLGPLGTGLLFVREGVEHEIESLRQGGTGTRSEEEAQPTTLPDKYEAGNHNAPGLAGLEAALAWIEGRGVAALREHEQRLSRQLWVGLRGVPSVTLYGPEDPHRRTGVVSLTIDGLDPQEGAAILDSHFGIECRAGLHCAPRMHRALGTLANGGTLRLSPGPFTTAAEIDRAIAAVQSLC